jgi:hypothetical protein
MYYQWYCASGRGARAQTSSCAKRVHLLLAKIMDVVHQSINQSLHQPSRRGRRGKMSSQVECAHQSTELPRRMGVTMMIKNDNKATEVEGGRAEGREGCVSVSDWRPQDPTSKQPTTIHLVTSRFGKRKDKMTPLSRPLRRSLYLNVFRCRLHKVVLQVCKVLQLQPCEHAARMHTDNDDHRRRRVVKPGSQNALLWCRLRSFHRKCPHDTRAQHTLTHRQTQTHNNTQPSRLRRALST